MSVVGSANIDPCGSCPFNDIELVRCGKFRMGVGETTFELDISWITVLEYEVWASVCLFRAEIVSLQVCLKTIQGKFSSD